MKSVGRILVFGAAIAMLGLCNPATEAGDVFSVNAGLPYWGYGFSGSLYGLGRVPVPPYFALHPPVYYGDRYARPFGASPFAGRSQMTYPDSYRPVPDGLDPANYRPHHHMFAPSADKAKTMSGRLSIKAKVILNPFCKQNHPTATAQVQVIENPYVKSVPTSTDKSL